MPALAWVALDDRDVVQTVLRSTLIKDVRDLPLFDEMFERFFSLPKAARPAEALVQAVGGAGATNTIKPQLQIESKQK